MDFNFIKSSNVEGDKELFFGPIDQTVDKFIPLTDAMTMADVMVAAGIFPSNSQARKNGWNKPVPDGFTDRFVGKYKTRITILKELA
jgi:hypothetical protein